MLERVVIVSPDRQRSAELAAEFPSLLISFATHAEQEPHLTASDWRRADFDTYRFDYSLDELARQPFTLRLTDDRGDDRFALEVLNRAQRHIRRRNRHSDGPLFDRVLNRHRELHDLDKPLVRADYNHAVDVWQWTLRLDGEASLPLQLAALFHDIERLVSEPDRRVEHLAADYQAFKDAHARTGAEMTDQILAECEIPGAVRAGVAEIVAVHERQSADSEVALLNDADALSFFSLNSTGYADYFGPEQTRKKVAYTLNRLRDSARAKLETIRLRDDVRAMLPGTSFATR